jgi:hypothetical protein
MLPRDVSGRVADVNARGRDRREPTSPGMGVAKNWFHLVETSPTYFPA